MKYRISVALNITSQYDRVMSIILHIIIICTELLNTKIFHPKDYAIRGNFVVYKATALMYKTFNYTHYIIFPSVPRKLSGIIQQEMVAYVQRP